MFRRVRVFRGVTIRRAIATQRRTTLLARAQVHPLRTNLHTLFADSFFRAFDFRDGIDMSANSFGRHFLVFQCNKQRK
jgi:hypothetical protein